MFGILLQLIASFFEEASESLGKDNVRRHLESPWVMGLLNAFVSAVILFALITLIRGWDVMTLHAWPTFLLRAVLLLTQSVAVILAIVKSERSTFGFLRVGTIPLLLLLDLLVGVSVSGLQVVGMMLISGTILFMLLNHGLSRNGLWYVIYTTVSAAFQLSLFRYNATHGNSVELESFLMMVMISLLFYVLARKHGNHPFAVFRLKRPLVQGTLHGVAMVFGSYAFLYAPASILLASARGAGIMASVFAGHWMFHEKKLGLKLLAFVGCAIGIILLAFGPGV